MSDTITSASRSLMEYITQPRHRSSSVNTNTNKNCLRLEVSGVALTVPYSIQMMVPSSSSEAEGIQALAEDVIQRAFREGEAIFSPFCESSELTKINRCTTTDAVIEVSSEMMSVLRLCNELVQWSDGVFDPTFVTLGKWCARYLKQRVLLSGAARSEEELQRLVSSSSWFPSEDDTDLLLASKRELVASEEFQSRLACTGWKQLIELPPMSQTTGPLWVRKRHPRVELDVSAVSKGWIVDRVLTMLCTTLDVYDVLVDWGGDIRTVGGRDLDDDAAGALSRNTSTVRQPWKASVLRPPPLPSRQRSAQEEDTTSLDHNKDASAVVSFPMEGGSLCTSGDYYQWCHLVDVLHPIPPHGGRGSDHDGEGVEEDIASLTLLLGGATCALCDGVSTALFLMLRRHGLDYVGRKLMECGLDTSVAHCTCVLRQGNWDDATSDGLLLVRDPQLQEFLAALGSASTDPTARQLEAFPTMASHLSSSSSRRSLARDFRSPSLDTSILRSINQKTPRSVCVAFFPDRSSSPAGRGGGEGDVAVIAVALSSALQVGDKHFYFCLEKQSVALHAFLATEPLGLGLECMWTMMFFFGPSGDANPSEFHTPQRLAKGTKDPLIMQRLPEAYALIDVQEVQRFDVGDHLGVMCVWRETRHRPASSGDTNLMIPGDSVFLPTTPLSFHTMRLGRSYVVTSPIASRQAPWRRLPRAQCVITVAHVASTAGGGKRVVRCLGTVLYGFDVSSRNPMLITGAVSGGPLNDILFSRLPQQTPPGDMILVRMHLFSHCNRDGADLVDWFRDTSCCDAGQQFMYHGMPSPKVSTVVPLPPDNNTQEGTSASCYHDYTFANSVATVDTVVVESHAVVVPTTSNGGGGYVLVLSPVQCRHGASSSSTASSSAGEMWMWSTSL